MGDLVTIIVGVVGVIGLALFTLRQKQRQDTGALLDLRPFGVPAFRSGVTLFGLAFAAMLGTVGIFGAVVMLAGQGTLATIGASTPLGLVVAYYVLFSIGMVAALAIGGSGTSVASSAVLMGTTAAFMLGTVLSLIAVIIALTVRKSCTSVH